MKTKLPLGINTAEQAMKFISALFNNNEHFNFEDDANTVFKEVNGKDSKIFTIREAKRVNELVGDCYAVKEFDPEKYLCELMESVKHKVIVDFDKVQTLLLKDSDGKDIAVLKCWNEDITDRVIQAIREDVSADEAVLTTGLALNYNNLNQGFSANLISDTNYTEHYNFSLIGEY